MNRRAFLGTTLVAPFVPKILTGEGHAIHDDTPLPAATTIADLSHDVGADTWVSVPALGRTLHRLLDRRTRDLGLRTVGGLDNKIGYDWGGSYFTHKPYAYVPEWPYRAEADGPKLLYDRVHIQALVTAFERELRAVAPRVTGRLELPGGCYPGAVNVVNARLVLRTVAVFDIYRDAVVLRLDCLTGTRA